MTVLNIGSAAVLHELALAQECAEYHRTPGLTPLVPDALILLLSGHHELAAELVRPLVSTCPLCATGLKERL